VIPKNNAAPIMKARSFRLSRLLFAVCNGSVAA
jgi:hypothetical protein